MSTLNTGQTLVNSGSVGLQAYTDDEPVIHSMKNFNNLAWYSIVEKIKDTWQVQNIKADYNFELAVKSSQKRQRSDWLHFLTTGRKL